jgi:hypothetical protein
MKKLLGLAVIAAVAAVLFQSRDDLQRYQKMRRM